MKQRLRYRFDRLLARGTWATLLWLGVVTLIVVAIGAVILAVFDVTFTSDEDVSFIEDFWQSLLRVLDPGTMAGDVGWGRRLLALGITLFGLLVAGTLIGIIAAGVEERIARMRSGRSVVFESGHVVVLGASDRLPTLVRQLVTANVGRDRAIVVMADRDAVELQEMVRRVVTDDRGTRLVFRTGDPTHVPDLEIVRVHEADTVIVLSVGDSGDSTAIRTVIAVDSVLESSDEVPMVVEVTEPASARHLASVYPTGVHPIVLRLSMSRIAAVALREPGAGRVAIALLDDVGSDIHISSAPSLENRTFAEINEAYAASRPIGYMGPDGSVLLNPPRSSRLEPGSRLVLVSESEDVEPNPNIDPTADAKPGPDIPGFDLAQPEQHLLVLGWSELGAFLLADWSAVAHEASTAQVFIDREDFEGVDHLPGLASESNIEVTTTVGFGNVAERLQSSPPIDTIVLLGSASQVGEDQADSRTLLSLVALRRLLSTIDGPTPRVIVEILDVDNEQLVEIVGDDDFVVSDALGSQVIAQLAEMPERRSVFLELYDPDGPSLHLVPARDLGIEGATRAEDIYRSSYQAGVVAIGYRSLRSGLVLNPPASHTVKLDGKDQLVIIG